MFSSHENETQPLSSSGGTSFGALESALCYLIASKRAGGTSDESRTEFSASFSALIDWAQSSLFLRQESEFPIFGIPPVAFGQEHEAWYDEKTGRWFKATYPSKFGLSWGSDSATPLEYIQRLMLQNDFFGDDIHLEAVVQCGDRIRILTSQSHVQGEAANYAEIQKWFLSLGYQRLEIGSRIAWYHLERNILVADAHEGNVIKDTSGELLPIDLNVVVPEGKMLEEIRTMIVVEPDWPADPWV
jgi:hypothetical protein